MVAIRRKQVREGLHASAWFANRDHESWPTEIEIRAPDYRGFFRGEEKTLFRLPGAPTSFRMPVTRLVVTEAPINAMSLTAGERLRVDISYRYSGRHRAAHAGSAEAALQALAGHPHALAVAAFDVDLQGKRYAGFLAEIATKADVPSERLTPPEGWNDWDQSLIRGADA